jgi:hypothetical protein
LLLQEKVRGRRSPMIGPPHRIGSTSSHMTRMRSMFLSVLETDLDLHVVCGVNTMHAVKGVGTMDFQLESGGSLKVTEVLHVPELKLNLLSVSALEDRGYERLYRLLGQPVIGFRGSLELSSRGSLEFGSVSMREQEAHLNRPMRFEMTLMEEEHMDPNQSPAEVADKEFQFRGSRVFQFRRSSCNSRERV